MTVTKRPPRYPAGPADESRPGAAEAALVVPLPVVGDAEHKVSFVDVDDKVLNGRVDAAYRRKYGRCSSPACGVGGR